MRLISQDNHEWPIWAPDWLRQQVQAPDCSNGTHPCLRQLAKWLTIYFREHEGAAERWLRHAAQHCDRDVPGAEVDRLIIWGQGLFGRTGETVKHQAEGSSNPPQRPQADLEEIYRIACEGPRLAEYRASSPQHLCGSRKTDEVLDAWGRYAGQTDPLICFGADDRFWTRPHSTVNGILHVHAQIVPNPMRAPLGMTQGGHLSEHSKDGTGPRVFLVVEFDFTKESPKGKPTSWVPLLERCESRGISAPARCRSHDLV